MQTLWDAFGDEFSERNTTMFALEGDEIERNPYANFIMQNPHNIFSKYENNLILGLWQCLIKIDVNVDVKFIL